MAGRYADSVAVLQEILLHAPANVLARAYLGLALHGAARSAEASDVLDYEGGVVVHEPLPEAQRNTLNAQLSPYICEHPSLQWSPPGKATHGGWQSGELLDGGSPIAATLQRFLQTAVDELLLGEGESGEELGPLRLSAWGLCLSSGGFQEPHVHQAAILSGVYYVSVPAMRGPTGAGSLRFSCSVPWLPRVPGHTTPPPHIVTPKEGMMVRAAHFNCLRPHSSVPR
jgi:hypothetical protein